MIQTHRLSSKEPDGDSNIMLYCRSDGRWKYAQYLTPRRGSRYGDWHIEFGLNDIEEQPGKGGDIWMDADFLCEAVFIDGQKTYSVDAK